MSSITSGSIKLSAEQIEDIKKFAGLFYSIDEIGIILQVDRASLKHAFRNTNSDVYLAYMHGFLKADSEIRISEISMAKNGSTPAQESVRKYIVNAKINNK